MAPVAVLHPPLSARPREAASPLQALPQSLRPRFRHPSSRGPGCFEGRGQALRAAPAIGLRATGAGSPGSQPLRFSFPISPVTPEVEVGADRRPRPERKAEAEREREAEPGELLS